MNKQDNSLNEIVSDLLDETVTVQTLDYDDEADQYEITGFGCEGQAVTVYFSPDDLQIARCDICRRPDEHTHPGEEIFADPQEEE